MENEKQWRLNSDLHEEDNLLDGFTFEQVITALRCNEKTIDEKAVKKVVKEILDSQMEDLQFLLENNMDLIIQKAKQNRN